MQLKLELQINKYNIVIQIRLKNKSIKKNYHKFKSKVTQIITCMKHRLKKLI